MCQGQFCLHSRQEKAIIIIVKLWSIEILMKSSNKTISRVEINFVCILMEGKPSSLSSNYCQLKYWSNNQKKIILRVKVNFVGILMKGEPCATTGRHCLVSIWVQPWHKVHLELNLIEEIDFEIEILICIHLGSALVQDALGIKSKI